ncbi:MAG TPA: hypothetical protein IAC25_06295 [Candidatus Enterenecus stercoripullorum]|nr:hypothetical protein [Candidatus Enterenecus stercoripullorum]
MIDAFDWVIRTYGQEMTCYDSSGTEKGRAMAIVQPMTEAEWQYTAGALGSYRTDRFLCLAQPQLPLDGLRDGGWVTWNGEKYEVMTVRPVLVAGRTTHLWIALRPAEDKA